MEADWRSMPWADFLIKWNLNPSKWYRTAARWRHQDDRDRVTAAHREN